MEYGLEAEDIQHVKAVFAANPKVKQVLIFGSRAMGTYKPGSDIDLAVSGMLTFSEMLELNGALEKLGLLCKFDLLHLEAVKDADVIEHIERQGKLLYP